MSVHSSELYKAPKVFYYIDMVYPQANTLFSCNLYIILYVVIFAIRSFLSVKQKLLTLQEYNIIYY